ncbi:MAG: hypothetical protein IIW77_08160 [Bacteroidaceae bacterium]|nr:hypothetical protein [Bacteroidaceae bacterium]
MKNTIKRFAVTLLFLATTVVAGAQALRTGYFLDGYAYRYRLNPALMNDQNYLSFPLLGEMNLKTAGNLGLADVLYDTPDGKNLVTFMHPTIDAEDFLGNINKNNAIAVDYDMTLLSTGFFAFGGYNTLDIGLHSHSSVNIPYDMFKFMKTLGGGTYSLGNMNVATRNYIDVAIGHSHKIGKDLTIGARFKVLLGAAYANLMVERMNAELTGERWMIDAKGALSAAYGGSFTYDENGMLEGFGENIVPGLNGLGMGIDLGVTYDLSNVLTKGLVVSASITDLGYMKWNNVSMAGFDPEPYVFDGFENVGTSAGQGESVDEQMEAIGRDLQDMFVLADQGVADVSENLSSTLHIGLEYKMPFYDKLSAAILYSNRFDEVYPYHQFSLMVNLAPVNWFSLAVSGTTSSMGMGFGAIANIHCTGFNIFVGSDCFIGKVNKQYIPLDNMNANVAVGINIPFGKKR